MNSLFYYLAINNIRSLLVDICIDRGFLVYRHTYYEFMLAVKRNLRVVIFSNLI